MTLQVVDPHIHLWDLSTGLYPWLETSARNAGNANSSIARTYALQDLLTDAGEIKVLKAIHVEAFPTDPVAETAYIQTIANAGVNGIPQGIVANADLTAPDLDRVLEAHARFANFRGIRQVLNRHVSAARNYVDRDFMLEPAFDAGFKLLERHGASFDLQIYPSQMADAAALAGRHPQTQIILNHSGMWVDRDLAGWRAWRDGMRELATCNNIAVKISGLGMLDTKWTVGSIRPLVLETLDAFGTDRVMFASNFPVDKTFSDYSTVWRAFAEIVADFSDDEKAGLFRSNAELIYRI